MRRYISAKFLLADAPPPKTVIPPNFKITQCPPRVAHGARKAHTSPRGDAPSTTHAARDTARVCATSRETLRGYAARR